MSDLATRMAARTSPEPNSGCWLWFGARCMQGYGRIMVGGAMTSTHRAAWVLANGPIPPGLCVCHRCDNRLCVNPRHLFVGTIADNNRDMATKKRSTLGERNWAAKLSAGDVVAIRKSPETEGVIARRFGVSASTVNAIRRRELWRHIP